MRYPLANYRITTPYGGAHLALDLAAPESTAVMAAVTGLVIDIGTDPNYIGGMYVIIREDHGDGLEYYTGHHSQVLVKEGQRVSEGETIALVGHTGPTSGPFKVTGPHVHFQIRRRNHGQLVNPADVLSWRTPPAPKAVVQAAGFVGKTAFLPPSEPTWRVYALGVTPVRGNEKTFLLPAKYGGLKYKIEAATQWPHVYTIQTAQVGKVNIYLGPDTSVRIEG